MNQVEKIENIEKTDIIKILDSIKQDVISTRNKIMYNANKELINMYFRMGKNISENAKYGTKFITILSKSLKLEFPDSTGFSKRNLWRMKAFYEEYKDFSILPPVVAQLPWTHNYILIEKIKDRDKRLWYADECLKNGWSKAVLIHQIELELYERKKLSNKFTNFDRKIELKDNSDLARLYQCTNGTKTINQTVKRHINRFPERFMFQLIKIEVKELRF